MPESVVLLHGFGGTHRAWDGVRAHLHPERYLPLALDLPGHGEQAGWEPPITFAGCVDHVLSRAPERFTLCGYSMGGRIALNVAMAAPERVQRLVLVSTTAGIEDEGEREERRAADRLLADELEAAPFEDFIERWRTQPLFADEPCGGRRAGSRGPAPQPARRPRGGPARHRHRRDGSPCGAGWGSWKCRSRCSLASATPSSGRSASGWWSCSANARLLVGPGGHNLPLESPEWVAEVID